jgi:hypothetical protein
LIKGIASVRPRTGDMGYIILVPQTIPIYTPREIF